jgi:hypothetical protein
VSLIWHYRIFTATNGGLIVAVHLLLGFSLASWAIFVAVPFGKSPQLAAISATFLSIVFAILALVFSHASTGAAFIFTLIFPPGFYIFAIRAICGFENHVLATNVLKNDPDDGLMLLPILIAAIVSLLFQNYFHYSLNGWFRLIFSYGHGSVSLLRDIFTTPENPLPVVALGYRSVAARVPQKRQLTKYHLRQLCRSKTWQKGLQIAHGMVTTGELLRRLPIFHSTYPRMAFSCCWGLMGMLSRILY